MHSSLQQESVSVIYNDHILKEAKKRTQLQKALTVQMQMQIQNQLQQLALPQEIQMQNQFQ